jgi:hypothetical protein
MRTFDASRIAAAVLLVAALGLAVAAVAMVVGDRGPAPALSLGLCALWTGYLGALMVSASRVALRPQPVAVRSRPAAHRP